MKKEKLFYTYIYTSVLEGLLNILTASSMMRDLWETCIISLFVFTLIICTLINRFCLFLQHTQIILGCKDIF